MNTLFNLPETFLIAALVDYFDNNDEYENISEGWSKQDNLTSFDQVFQASKDGNNLYQRHIVQDVRNAVDDIHLRSLTLKQAVVRRTEEFVKRDARLGSMLAGIRQSGRRSFLLTNSDWWYTNNIMSFLLGGQSACQSVSQSISQSACQSVSQSISQSVSQLFSQSVSW